MSLAFGQLAEELLPARVQVVPAAGTQRVPARVIHGNDLQDGRADERQLEVSDDDGNEHVGTPLLAGCVGNYTKQLYQKIDQQSTPVSWFNTLESPFCGYLLVGVLGVEPSLTAPKAVVPPSYATPIFKLF